MPPRSPSSGRVRRFFKRVARGVKKVLRLKSKGPAPHSPHAPPPVPAVDPSPQLVVPHKLTSALPPRPLSQSQKLGTLPQPIAVPQPTPSASEPVPSTSHLVNNGTLPADAESRLAMAARKAGADAWVGLRTTLQLLERSSDIFPTLKSAVAEFLGVIGTFEAAAQNRNDYTELAASLHNVVREFAERPGEHTSSRFSEALKAVASGLEKEMEHLQEQQQRSEFKHHPEVGQDLVDVPECYRLVETLRRELQNKELVGIWRNQEKQKAAAHLKKLNAALKAMYDSSLTDVVGRRTCTPGTREAILAEMREWAGNLEGSRVYWLNGMAGTGKTTLAYSLCAEMQRARRLGASFFCSRADADSRDVMRIVPTIAHQLARLLPAYREALVRQIDEDDDIGAWTTKTQFEKLIRDPLREVEVSVPKGIVVMIDALDECDSHDGARDILSVLLANARDLPIKFFVTCRPEPWLFEVLHSKDERYRSVLHLHDIDAAFVQADIQRYLEAELAETSLTREKLGMLAEQAGALFIYAATAVRYIYPRNRRVNVHQRLDDLLSIASKDSTHKHKGIDELYAVVLSAPFAENEFNPQEKENIRLVLETAICAREPMSVATMAKLMELDKEHDVIQALQHLRSVLNVSPGTHLISTLHASFIDFMLDRSRSEDLWCDAVGRNQHLALRCFSAMERLLRFNICELESSFTLDDSIPDLAQKVDEAISPELFYACRYWGAHLVFAEAPDNYHAALDDFLSNRLLFWMEVLNLRKCIDMGTRIVNQVHAWLQKSADVNNVLELALDAGRFVTAFGLSPASRSTPHIYISALPFWPPTRPVRLRYWKRTQGLMRLEGTGVEGRDVSCLATWKIGSAVSCAAHSPDGTRIASGFRDSIIRVWDAQSGVLVIGPLEGHDGWISAVAFSPDGTRIASGSDDDTVCAWDAQSGVLIAGPLEGHTSSVHAVAFSPDGTRIVSGSFDNTIRVWDARSGLLVAGPFEGHIRAVRSVRFSPDGTRIVSGSDDSTIRVWDARSGVLVAGPFEGHTDLVYSVAFSPDGTRVVSGSWDNTIRLWDAQTGLLVAEPFEGHTDWVESVAFSPDGSRIVSGSHDGAVRVWDAQSGVLVAGPFEGHTSSVFSAEFSPNGARIVSISDDCTIRVWDAQSKVLVAGPFKGHTSAVNSAAFSPDGARIVSGSNDNTIRVWDTQNGLLVAGPFEGHTKRVYSVAFSPNGTRIVSGSWDKTVRVWDAQSGLLVAGPFEEHSDFVNCVAFSSDGDYIVSGSHDKTILVWNAQSGALVAGPFEGHDDIVSSVAFSPDGTRIVSGSYDDTIRVWDTQSGLLVAGPFEEHSDYIKCVAFSPDGNYIVSSSEDETILVWNAQSGALVAGPFEGHAGIVNSVAFSPDGACVVSGSDDKTIRVWDAQSGLLVAGPFEGHTDSVVSVGFSPDGTHIVSGSRDNAIRVWATTPLHSHNPEHFKDWVMDETGMICTREKEVLLNVPVDLWTGLIRAQNRVCIYDKGVLKLDFDGMFLGNEWINCYQCQ